MPAIPFNPAYLNFSKMNSKTAADTQKNYQRITSDLSSGGLVEDYKDVKDVKLFVSNEVELEAGVSYQNGDNYNLQRMTITSAKLNELRQIANNLQREISMTVSNTWAPISNLVEVAQNAQKNVKDVLNSTFNNQYLFSGTTTISPAVDSIDDPGVTTGGVVTNTYYIGNEEAISFKADAATDITIDLNAGDDFAAELIYAINLCVYVSGTANDPAVVARLGRANDLCNSAAEKVIAADTKLQVQMKSLRRIQDNLQLQEQILESSTQQLGYKTPVDALKQYVDATTSLAIAQTLVTKNNYIETLIKQL